MNDDNQVEEVGNVLLEELTQEPSTDEAPQVTESDAPQRTHSKDNVPVHLRTPFRSKYWTKFETNLFFKALAALGTDFRHMSELFPHRTLEALRSKYKKEDKRNKNIIVNLLNQPKSATAFEQLKLDVKLIEQQWLTRVSQSKAKKVPRKLTIPGQLDYQTKRRPRQQKDKTQTGFATGNENNYAF
ncbi:uncharacterized protein LOC109605769 [Aethina tumida]|uniref:uncharacterized protein LOC109605769 n=1 Tax=Aethina tumida TaxID=116153 RepID=UPI002148F022|nr:uncharacterized protein LOC109605769 [Aethina tumida]